LTKYISIVSRARIRQWIKRSTRWLALVAVVLLLALTADRIVPALTANPPAAIAAPAPAEDAALQSVLAYLRAHSGAQPAPTATVRLDPAQQSVMQYVHAHDRPAPPAKLWDRVSQAVLDFLRARAK
jgi:hypothetical protein